MNAEKNIDLGVWVILSGLIFARLFYVFFYEPSYFLANPVDVVKLWQGGMSSFGGLFGALLVFVIFIKQKKILVKDLSVLGDVFAFSALYGWMLGRVGCVMIHDHLGRLTTSFLSVKTIDGTRYEMAFLEILGLVPLAITFFILKNKRVGKGIYTSILFIYYGILRFGLDFFRATDILHADARYLGLTPGQYFGIVLAIVGVYLLRKVRIVV